MWACRHSKDQKDPSCSSMFIVLSVLLNAYQFISILFRMSTINLSFGKHTKHLWNGCKSIYLFFNYPESYGFSSLPANLLTWSSHFCMISASSSLILCSNNHTKMIITKIIWVLLEQVGDPHLITVQIAALLCEMITISECGQSTRYLGIITVLLTTCPLLPLKLCAVTQMVNVIV